jgi:hypothetical protein
MIEGNKKREDILFFFVLSVNCNIFLHQISHHFPVGAPCAFTPPKKKINSDENREEIMCNAKCSMQERKNG